jgi:hypothetical protein
VTADDYLSRVDAALRDLPWSQRRELLAELRSHLAELPAGTDLRELGTPEEYAADLRSAAGLERRHGPVAFLRARRPRNVLLTLLALTVIGLAIGAVAWIQSYQPISFAGASQLPVDSRPAVGSDGDSVVFRKGRPFQYGITIQNTGRFAVRVLGVPDVPGTLPFSARLLMSGPQKEPGMEAPFTPFHSFDLKPGEIRRLLFKGIYACHSGLGPGQSLAWTHFPVRFSFLWKNATVQIPLDNPLTFVAPHGCSSSGAAGERYAVTGR